ncbi:MAG: DNA-directed RNA polymerase subunit alpha [Nitrospinae bacterium]|nr:DNA-directed RNA polymerase subunit alpha [Nitrospinota bacterium]
MNKSWHGLTSPKKLECDRESLTASFGKFIAEPLEKGFAQSIGTSLRRFLLSSIKGVAVAGVRVEGVNHEFSVMKGVQEDVMDVILNLKELRIKMEVTEPTVLKVKKKGKGEITGADIIVPEGVTILNPELKLVTLTDDIEFNAELLVNWGRGYEPAERTAQSGMPADFIPIDACFSPVESVTFNIEKTFVGQSADFERLIVEINTDGSVSPEDALAHAAKIMKDHVQLFINFDDSEEKVESKSPEKKSKMLSMLLKNVADLELSVRASNCLANAQINTLYELVTRTDDQMLKTKNLGRKSLNEIKELLEQMNLSLYMTIDEETSNQYKEAMERRRKNGESEGE